MEAKGAHASRRKEKGQRVECWHAVQETVAETY